MADAAHHRLAWLPANDVPAARRFVRARHRAALALARIFLDEAGAGAAVNAAWRDWVADLGDLANGAAANEAFFTHIVERLPATGRTDIAARASTEPDEPVLPDWRFDPDQSWAQPMKSWDALTENDMVDGAPLKDHLATALADLSAPQRAVIVLRDIAGLSAATVAGLLGIDEPLQRTLLHRAHARLRRAIEIRVGM